MKRLLTYTTSLVSLLLVASCYDHKELIHDKGSGVPVIYDWTGCPDAAPSIMMLMVYNGSAQPVRFPMRGAGGGNVDLTYSSYKFIGYNDDTETMLSRGSNWNDFEIYSIGTEMSAFAPMFSKKRAAIPRAPYTDNQPIIYEAEQLWTGVSEQTLEYGFIQPITLKMQEATHVYNFVITNVQNLGYVSEMAATISGMSGSWFPARHSPSDTECIVPFNLQSDGGTTITAQVRCFGHCPGHSDTDGTGHYDHQLVIYAEMKDGSRVYYTVDVTESMHDADHQPPDGEAPSDSGGTDVPIVIDGLPLPKPITNGSGFQPSVGDWEEIHIDLHM